MQILTAAEMAETDRRTAEEHGTPFGELMENAGTAVARFVAAQYPEAQRIAVLCGTGNNGGDGFVAARAMLSDGLEVAIVLLGDEGKLTGAAADAFGLLDRSAIHVERFNGDVEALREELANVDVILDSVVGTGFKPPLRGPAQQVREMLQGVAVPVIAIDLPSGWDADSLSESADNAFRADAVVTFTAPNCSSPHI